MKRRSPNSETPSESGGKKNVAAKPATYSGIAKEFTIYLCERILSWKPFSKAACLVLFTVCVSCITDIIQPLPHSLPYYLSKIAVKQGVLNQWFSKWAWGWTFFTTMPFLGIVAWICGSGRKRILLLNASRMLAGTVCWFSFTWFFLHVEKQTAFCTDEAFVEKRLCVAAGGKWIALDISGHTFLLVFASLTVLEEAKAYWVWFEQETRLKSIGKPPGKEYLNSCNPAGERREELDTRLFIEKKYYELEQFYHKYQPYMRLNFVFLAIVSTLLDISFVITIIFYHNIVQKFLGCVSGVLAWWLIYVVVYPALSLEPGSCRSAKKN